MGVVSGIKGMLVINRIKNGKSKPIELLSVSQVTRILVNMNEARQNLNENEFAQVHNLYRELVTENTPQPIACLSHYLKMAVRIIKEFNEIAPYEKYSGGNKEEVQALMSAIRQDKL